MLKLILSLSVLAVSSAIAQSPPPSFQHSMTYNGQTVTANLSLHPIRSAHFEVKLQGAGGSYTAVTPDVPRTYLGTIVGKPGAWAMATRLADGTVWAHVAFEDGTEWFHVNNAVTEYNHAWTPALPTSPLVGSGGAGSHVYAAELAIDSSNAHFVANGSNVNRTVAMIEHSVMAANYIYLRDVGILHQIGRIVIRGDVASDPYPTASSPLGFTRDEWFSNQLGSRHLMAATVLSYNGGLAYLHSVGEYNGISINNFRSSTGECFSVLRHEMGHNWGPDDYEGGTPEGESIMNGNSLARFAGVEQAQILSERSEKQALLTDLGNYTFPLPPRATLDVITTAPGVPVIIDTMRNDHDANGERIYLHSFDATSAKGATLSRSIGTGPHGRDQIHYTPSATMGLDSYTYRIMDTSGMQGTSKVFVNVTAAGNHPPVWDTESIATAAATSNAPYTNTLAARVRDPNVGDSVSFTKVSGPAWLTVAANGGLSGTPTVGTLGINRFVVRAKDNHGAMTDVVLNITVRLGQAYTDVSTDLVVHLPLDSNASDTSGRANHASAIGLPTYSSGRIGNGVQLTSATQYLTLGTPTDLNFGSSTGFTVSFWVKAASWSDDTPLIGNKDWSSGSNVGWIIAGQTDGTTWQWNGKASGGSRADYESGGLVADGQWHLVTVTHQRSGNATFYHDGSLLGSVSLTSLGSSIDTGLPTVIGRDAALVTYGTMDPMLDDVMIWRRVLSTTEVAQIAEEGRNGRSAHPFNGQPPVFSNNPIALPAAAQGNAYATSLASFVTDADAGDTKTFSKLSGPAWLGISANGNITGTPTFSDVGATIIEIRVTDSTGNTDQSTLTFNVANTNDAPSFTSSPLLAAAAGVGLSYSGNVSSLATDLDVPETLTFIKLSGPEWLNLATNGELSGTPSQGNLGANNFILRVSDSAGASSDATLTIQVNAATLADLKVHLPLDGNPRDISGRGNHGIAAGSPANVTGQIQLASELNTATKHISLGTPSDLNFGSGDFTVALWIKTNGWGSGNDPVIIGNKNWSSGSNLGWNIAGQTDGSGWQWNFKGSGGSRADFENGGNIADGVWHHIAVSHTRGGFAQFYQDGVAIGSVSLSATGGSIDTGLPTVIRDDALLAYGTPSMASSIDDVAIWSRALNASEIGSVRAMGVGNASFQAPTLISSNANYISNTPISITYSNGPANTKDWIGLYLATDGTGAGWPAADWQYVDGTRDGSVALSNGTLTFSTGLTTPGNYVARFLLADGYTILTTTVFTVQAPVSPLDAWRSASFGNNASDLTIAGDHADPDRDGFVNLIEFTLGSDPLSLNSTSQRLTTQRVGGSARFSFPRSDTSEGSTTVQLDYSTDLITWTSVTIGSTSSTGTHGETITIIENSTADSVTVDVELGNSSRCYGRLRVALAP